MLLTNDLTLRLWLISAKATGLFLAAFLGIALAMNTPALARDMEGQLDIALDIPAQPLAAALYTYSAVTGIEVVADGTLISGRRSAALKGSFVPENALKTLLAGTGLTIRRSASDAFVLVAAPVAEIRQLPDPPRIVPDYADYAAHIQTKMKRALCQLATTEPGAYRAVVELWITSSGAVQRGDLLSSTGSQERDAAISAMLSELAIGEAPPAGLPQPVTLMILPRSPADTGDCRDG
jgi:hypothetical protein